jgi:hypothetical protein
VTKPQKVRDSAVMQQVKSNWGELCNPPAIHFVRLGKIGRVW